MEIKMRDVFFGFPRIKAFTQTKSGPISGCKFSTQIKAFPFSHPQVGYFVTALDTDEMCVFAAHLRFLSRQERYLWVMGHKPLIAAKICRLVKNHRGQDLNRVYNERFGHGIVF